MATDTVIVMGGSAGCVEPLRRVIAGVPPNLRAAIVVAIHMLPRVRSQLASILDSVTVLPVQSAGDGLELLDGRIYVAQPDRHVLVERGHVHLSRGPKENHVRPALNPLFRSAAISYGASAIGVLLSGTLDDGAAGLWEIKRRGGVAIVQAPGDAVHPDMPCNAIQEVPVDYIEPAAGIGPLLGRLAETRRNGNQGDMAMTEEKSPVDITCPECRGPMGRIVRGKVVEYQCRVKHTYSAQSMLAAHAETEERTLWAAVLALDEGADLLDRIKQDSQAASDPEAAGMAQKKRDLAQTIRESLSKE